MNTGRLIYKTLVEVDEETGLPTGNVKLNDVNDPDYVAPMAVALGNCPIQYDQFGSGLVFITTATTLDISTIVMDIESVELIIWGDGIMTSSSELVHNYADDSTKIVMIQVSKDSRVQMTQTEDIMQVIYKSNNTWLQ